MPKKLVLIELVTFLANNSKAIDAIFVCPNVGEETNW
jgi:hypothetical protein